MLMKKPYGIYQVQTYKWNIYMCVYIYCVDEIGGLLQKWCNLIVKLLELQLYCIKPLRLEDNLISTTGIPTLKRQLISID